MGQQQVINLSGANDQAILNYEEQYIQEKLGELEEKISGNATMYGRIAPTCVES